MSGGIFLRQSGKGDWSLETSGMNLGFLLPVEQVKGFLSFLHSLPQERLFWGKLDDGLYAGVVLRAAREGWLDSLGVLPCPGSDARVLLELLQDPVERVSQAVMVKAMAAVVRGDAGLFNSLVRWAGQEEGLGRDDYRILFSSFRGVDVPPALAVAQLGQGSSDEFRKYALVIRSLRGILGNFRDVWRMLACDSRWGFLVRSSVAHRFARMARLNPPAAVPGQDLTLLKDLTTGASGLKRLASYGGKTVCKAVLEDGRKIKFVAELCEDNRPRFHIETMDDPEAWLATDVLLG